MAAEGRTLFLIASQRLPAQRRPWHDEQADRVRVGFEPDVSLEAEALIELFEASFSPAPPSGDPAQPSQGANAGLPDGVSSELSAKVDVTRANLVRWFQESIITNPIGFDEDRPEL